MFTNPLDRIRIASPCKSDWNEMYGDERRRFCAECKLNVYNLSGMTRAEAERLLINSEGRLCVRFFRRKDGTVLTKDCPVGWKAVKRRVSKYAVAMSSIVAGLFAGILSVRTAELAISSLPVGEITLPDAVEEHEVDLIMGEAVDDMTEWEGKVVLSDALQTKSGPGRLARYTVGQIENIQRLDDVKVEAWIK